MMTHTRTLITAIIVAPSIAHGALAVDLQGLIDAAKPQSVVVVLAGVYDEPIVIRKALPLRGQDRAKCRIEVTADESAIFIQSKQRVTIDSLTIRWQLATSGPKKRVVAALVARDTPLTLQDCHLEALGNFKRSPSALTAARFFQVAVRRCRFDGHEFAVCIADGSEGLMRDCVVLDPGHCGITVFAGSKLTILKNIVARSGFHGIRSTGGTLIAKDNLIINNDNRGFYLGNKSAHGLIRNNVILGNAMGIGAFARTDVKVANNLILDSTFAGIGTRYSCRLSIQNNVIAGNQRGIILLGESGHDPASVQINSF